MSQNQSVIIVAGGRGERMKSNVPKQFLELSMKPVLMHTIENFHRFDPKLQMVLVLPEDQIGYWKELCDHFQFTVKHEIAKGGSTRFESVTNGLKLIGDSQITGVHDGVRPLVSHDTLKRCYDCASEKGSAVPVLDMFESVREITGEGQSRSVDRSLYKLVQTPQVFQTSLLKEAYRQEYDPLFTDDASVVESLGHKIHLVEGNRENIKITTPIDIKIAETLL